MWIVFGMERHSVFQLQARDQLSTDDPDGRDRADVAGALKHQCQLSSQE
jgi:hypothetical protein